MDPIRWSDIGAWLIRNVYYVLDVLQFLRSLTKNDLGNNQIYTLCNDLSSYQNRISIVSTLMTQLIQAMTMPTSLFSKW